MKNLDTLLDKLPTKKFEAGEVILEKGQKVDQVFIIISGSVSVSSVDKNGVERRILSTEEYEIMPSGWLADPVVRPIYTYRARTKAICAIVDKTSFEEKLLDNPDAMFELLLVQDQRVQFAKLRIEMLVQSKAEDKMLYMMRYMSHRFGRITSDLDWIKIEPDLTQAHLADSLGLTRETSGQALKSLEKKGIIRTTSRTHYEVNIKKLKPLIK